jgi:DNA mismatch repair endonuclease MutH
LDPDDRGGALSTFDPNTASEEQVIERAAALEGMRVGDIPGARFAAIEARRGKGEVGLAIEAYFQIPPNAIGAPDFPAAGIELKVVPLVTKAAGIRVKERTVVSMIDFHSIVSERWETASVRKKLKILFVFFEHFRGRRKEHFPIHAVLLWQPRDGVEDQIRRDWETVRTKVRAGLAHQLSETDGRILGPCTKGADSATLRTQPFSEVKARSRAFALKPYFTFALYAESGAALDTGSLAETATLEGARTAFSRFVGRTIDDVAAEVGIRPSTSKSYAANVVHRAVAEASPLPRSEFDAIGPTVKMTRVDRDNYPYEAVSFPAFRHLELAEEEWEDSDLLSRIEHMLIVPVFGRARDTPQGECIIREPVYWTPRREDLHVIEREWTTFRDLIRNGNANRPPTEATTTAIHVRPLGRDASDRDPTPGGGSQTKKSFWFNRRFVQDLLRRETDQPKSRPPHRR